MLNIVGSDIEINRGNAAGLTLHFEGDDKPADGTKVIFQVKPVSSYNLAVIEKEATVENDSVDIDFLSEDTQDLKPGIFYWNACIQFTNGLEPWTIMKDWSEFRVLPG